MKHIEPELIRDHTGRWWVAVPVPCGLYGTTHDVRKRMPVAVPRGASREEAERAVRGMHGEEE